MAKSARRRHTNNGGGDAGKAVQNGNHGNKAHGKSEKKTEASPGGYSCWKVCLFTVVIAAGAILTAYYLNENAKSVIDSTLVHYEIADLLQFSTSKPEVPHETAAPVKQEETVTMKNEEKVTVNKEDNTKSDKNKRTESKTKSEDIQDENVKPDKDVKRETKPKKKSYAKSSITNSQDKKIRSELDEADDLREKGKIEKALDQYNAILKRYPKSPRAHYGKAESLDKLAAKRQSNMLLEESIQEFVSVLDLPDAPDDLVILSGRRAAERMNFRGWSAKAAKTLTRLTQKYPSNIEVKNLLGVAYLMSGKAQEARPVFKSVLEIDPKDGFALVHMGFIYKTTDNDPAKAIPLLREGVQTRAPGTLDGRFYFHLGDSLQRVGQKEEAYQVYKDGADRGLFRSMFQRSLYNVDHLTGRPWWTVEQTTYKKALKMLENNWQTIRDEGLAQMDVKSGAFLPEEENLRETGDWKQFTLYQRGQKNVKNCGKTPKTCALIDKIPDAKGCKRGQVKFSVMQPGVHVWPHCGPTNCRIRAHLGLVVPEGPKISVAGTEGKWKEGKFIIFDDSFEHEVWHYGDSFRLVLIIDFWHPELTDYEKASLSSI